MHIAAAQIQPIKGYIAANKEAHKRWIALAIAQQADAIFFPELSLSGYEPELAESLAIHPADKDLDDFQNISNTHTLTIGLGMPTQTQAGICISMLIFQPHRPRQTYAKQQLHADELPYFVPGTEQLLLPIGNKKIAPAICYESLQTDHAAHANKLGADLYVASVAKSQAGMDKALKHYPAIAKRFSMPVLMSNCIGHCDNFYSVGKSAIWTKEGMLAGQLDDKQEGIIIFDTETEAVIQHTL